jgi:NAD(P)-dependent dehydrogenase (short-subunit alcohol dehydrogenase family)
MGDFDGLVAAVTGGASGIGLATATLLASRGAQVACLDVNAGDVKPPLCGIDCDVTDDASVRAAVGEVVSRFGRLDVLVNNAGVDLTLPFEEIDEGAWDRILEVNLHGPANMARAAWPVMREAGGGAIVNIVSTAARRAWANASAYHASKWGLLGLSHALHVEGRGCGIAVSAVIAGGMRTPFLLDRFPDIPLENLQEPENVAEAVRFALMQPQGSVVAELMILPMKETSWP